MSRRVNPVPRDNRADDVLRRLSESLHLKHRSDGTVDVYGKISDNLLWSWMTQIDKGDAA